MNNLNPLQKNLLELAPIGKQVQVTTSTWTIYTDSFKPITYCTHAALKGLVKRGLITARFYWRGADIIRLA
jgi:hypothetical protein